MRVPRTLAILLSTALLAACGGAATPDPSAEAALAAARDRAARDHESMAGGKKLLPVMTRNLYLGADLDPVIGAVDPQHFAAAAAQAWATVQGNDFHVRAEAIADEIAAARPALVGLQEAFLWRTITQGDQGPVVAVAYDYVHDLIAALAARGLAYREVVEVELLDMAVPVSASLTVRATDREVILARGDVTTARAEAHVFEQLLPISVLGQPLSVKRGWVSAEVKYRGEWLRFVSTHLEAFHPGIRTLQAGELAAALADEPLPVVLVGDLNSNPGTEGEAVLAAAGYQDLWAAVHPDLAGLTCCFPEDLHAPGELTTRIDYVLYRGTIEPWAAEVLGGAAADRVGGLWPSDHAGLAGVVRVVDERHFVGR